jgi:hypothetical protein
LVFSPVAGELSAVVADHRPRHHSRHGRKKHVSSDSSEGSALPQVSKPEHEHDGMPHLPAVSSMLGTASETLKSINTQANSLEARVVQVQTENEAKMARQKAVFDRRLKAQEEANRAIVKQSAEITKETTELKDGNVALRKHAKELQVDNRLLRIELQALQTKLGVSRDFVTASLTSTDDSKAKELLILKEAKKAEKHEDYDNDDSRDQDDDNDDREDDKDDDDDSSDDDAGASFITLSSSTRKSGQADGAQAVEAALTASDLDGGDDQQKPQIMNPKDLLKVLQKGVDNLVVEEKEGESKLKTMFLSDFQAGSRRHISLTAQQKTLNATRASVKQRETLLKVAESHLEHTKSHLESRLRGLGLFLQKLAHVALAPSSEVPQMIKALPSTVSIPPPKESKKKVEM